MFAYTNASEMIFYSRARANEMADLTRNEKIAQATVREEGKGEYTRIRACNLRYCVVT